jgi:hypothetical protein
LKKRSIIYIINVSESLLNGIIRDEIMCETSTKKYNLAGESTNFGGFIVYKNMIFGYSKSSINPLIKLHLKCVKVDDSDLKSKLILKRVDGESFEVHRAIAIVFAVVMAIVSSYQILNHGFMDFVVFSILPIFGIVYYFIVEFIAKIYFKSLCKKVEEIMQAEGIVYSKQTR